MLSNNTYEGYYHDAGDVSVDVVTHPSSKITPHMEIRYARYRGWIQDA